MIIFYELKSKEWSSTGLRRML